MDIDQDQNGKYWFHSQEYIPEDLTSLYVICLSLLLLLRSYWQFILFFVEFDNIELYDVYLQCTPLFMFIINLIFLN